MLKIKDLSIGCYDRQASCKPCIKTLVSDINLVVRPGELVAVVGGSGAGKSLLAHAIMGILSSDFKVYGRIEFKKHHLTHEMLRLHRGRTIVFVPQSVECLDPLLRVGDSVYLAALRTGLARKSAKEFRDRVLKQLDLPVWIQHKYPNQISGGMARRILLACAMVTRAELFIADEPTPGLHAKSAEICVEFLKKRTQQGNSALMISHDIELCLKFADRIAVFHEGSIVETVASNHCTPHHTRVAHPYTRALLLALPSREFKA